MTQRKQLNVTITDEQKAYVLANFGKMNTGQLSKMLGLTYNKCHNNLKVMGLFKPRTTAKVIKMDGYFDLEEFAKQYSY